MQKILKAVFLSLLVVSTACISVAAQDRTPPESFEIFADWCLNQTRLPPEEQHTVDVLLTISNTQDCERANRVLAERTELNLNQRGIASLSVWQSTARSHLPPTP